MPCENPVQEVIVDFIYETESREGNRTIHAYALDGRILLITKPNPTKLAELKKAESLLRPTKLKQPDKTTEDDYRTNNRGVH
jgi:hypothetical protein